MSSFEELKVTLPAKWLDYYQINRSWINALMEFKNWWHKTPDGGKRPHAQLILGAITTLEPKLVIWMTPFCELNPDSTKLVEVLGLNFDPDIELEKRANEVSNLQNSQTDPYLEEIRKQNQN